MKELEILKISGCRSGNDGSYVSLNEYVELQANFDKLKSDSEALAAENAVMLRLLTDISENHVEYFSEGEGYIFAGVPLYCVSEISTYVSRDVNAENPFPATDAYLNSVRAECPDCLGAGSVPNGKV